MNVDIQAILPSVVVVLVGWLLSRSIKAVDSKLAELGGKVDSLAARDGEHEKSLITLTMRITQLEATATKWDVWRDDIARFLQRLDFKERPKRKPE